ncbi:MAG: Periplasmic copper-binding protein (NosD) [Candidatus Methanoperedenaceae archaeon GB50]|nr:MAG: Periplasmic copper-binding protein (NosD) [Candidatus Methanoperedenaceae archaeon GB50]
MKRAIITGLGFSILLLAGCGGAGATDIYVGPGETHTTIQGAINAASSGDTIIVRDGTYTENLDVGTAHLTIKSENAENGAATTTVHAASSSDHVFDITADYVNISGFTVTGATGSSKAGIYINAANHCNISDNLLTENNRGIYLRCVGSDTARFNVIVNNTVSQNGDNGIRLQGANCDNNTVRNNIVSANDEGIYIYFADYNNITGNTVLSNTAKGIYLTSGADYNNISCNTILNNAYRGISLLSSNYNILAYNDVNDNGYHGIYLESSNHNTITGNNASWNEGDGIVVLGHIHPTSYNNISDNIANHNDAGITLFDEDSCTIVNNTANSNNVGISLKCSYNNEISCNTILNNINDGFYLYDADDNNITCNWVAFNEKHGFHLISRGWENSTGNNISYNNIIANGEYNSASGGYEWQFYNDQEEDVSAINNWWGTTDDNEIDASIYDDEEGKGKVTYTPKSDDGPLPCAPIPEPATLVMVALGLLSVIGLLYRSGASGR